eukprot:scaffold44026_cov54-Attheya_sp.AAC.1
MWSRQHIIIATLLILLSVWLPAGVVAFSLVAPINTRSTPTSTSLLSTTSANVQIQNKNVVSTQQQQQQTSSELAVPDDDDDDYVADKLPSKEDRRHLLQEGVRNSWRKVPGSLQHVKAWRVWSLLAIDAIRSTLKEHLASSPTCSETTATIITVDEAATRELSFQLGVSADMGTMPSGFNHAGARSGYAVEYFCRARLLADLLFESTISSPNNDDNNRPPSSDDMNQTQKWRQQPPFLHKALDELGLVRAPAASDDDDTGPNNREDRTCQLVSLGGGPGFDFVAAALIATYNSNDCHPVPTRIQATILDYEMGWSDQVTPMVQALQQMLPHGARHSCHFGGSCDITRPLSDPSNACLLVLEDNETHQSSSASSTSTTTMSNMSLVESTDLWICSYCVAENANRLRQDNYVFFANLFATAKEGSIFIFTETTHRLWPELMQVAFQQEQQPQDNDKQSSSSSSSLGSNNSNNNKDHWMDRNIHEMSGFEVAYPRSGRGKGNFQLVLQKKQGAPFPKNDPEILELCQRFKRDNEMHQQKVESGFQRQVRKIPGAKQ